VEEMPSYLHPGVYIEEIPSGSKPIEGVATSVSAFVGFANRGPVGEPTLIGNFDDYVKIFGPIVDKNDAMGLSVQAFYLNGGGSAYICRLAGDIATSENQTHITGEGSYNSGTNIRTATVDPVLTIKASSPGVWGDELRFKIEKENRDARLFSLVTGTLADGKFVEDSRFEQLSMNASSDDYIVTRINQESSQIRVSIPQSQPYQSARVSGADVNLPNLLAYLTDASKSKSFMISVNGSAPKTCTLPAIFSNASTRADIASALQEQIRTALAITEIEARVNTNAFEIETTGTASSSSEIQLIDSELLTALGLSSSNVATLTGADAGATPSITSGKKFSVTLDAFKTVEINFASNFSGGAAIAAEIQRQLRNAYPDIASFSGFTCSFNTTTHTFTLKSGGSDVLESSITLTDGTGTPLVTLKLDAASAQNGRSIQQGIDKVVPRAMSGSNPAPGFGERLHNGKNTAPVASDFTSFYNSTLRKYRDVSIMVLPGSSWDGASGQANIAASLAHCESMKNRMLILDLPNDKELKNATVVSSLGLPTSTYSVLYYPWVSMANPGYHPDKAPNADKNVPVAPSAIAAGMWARIDGKRGVWKAPAGVEARVTGAAGLQYQVENLEQDQLNPLGINCIRKLPNYGSVFWGSRSLATKADPEWRYVPVRRTAIYIEESIYNGIQWAVFEPNNHHLWSSLRANVGSFMNGLFRAGAFQGQTANDAYFVRCGLGDTMTQGDIDRGQVIVTIGFAPLKPAEFVIVRIQQKVGEE